MANVCPPQTATGVHWSIVVLSPNWPLSFLPHIQATPLISTAPIKFWPQLISQNVCPPQTATGVFLLVVELIPN